MEQFGQELGFLNDEPINESAIRLATSENSAQLTHHTAACAAFIREQIENMQIELRHIELNHQLVNTLTEALPMRKFLSNKNLLMKLISILLFIVTGTLGFVFDETKPII